MEISKIEQIKHLISKAEIESAKSQGIIENIRKDWKSEYGTDDIDEIEKKLSEMKDELQQSNERLEKLYEKLVNSYDWEQLEQELGA